MKKTKQKINQMHFAIHKSFLTFNYIKIEFCPSFCEFVDLKFDLSAIWIQKGKTTKS